MFFRIILDCNYILCHMSCILLNIKIDTNVLKYDGKCQLTTESSRHPSLCGLRFICSTILHTLYLHRLSISRVARLTHACRLRTSRMPPNSRTHMVCAYHAWPQLTNACRLRKSRMPPTHERITTSKFIMRSHRKQNLCN